MKTISFSIKKIFETLPDFESQGITELVICDKSFSHDKKQILKLVDSIKENCPNLFVSLEICAEIIDKQLVQSLSEIYCSLEIPFVGTEKNGILLFDKKFYSKKIDLLNEAGLVFGFNMGFALQIGDTFKAFRNRLDFAISLYPNHIEFAQLENKFYEAPKSTGIYSSKDIDFSRGMAFACKTFYSCGRAVPWFVSVVNALKIEPSSFFADFEEFQLCNNCSFESGYKPDNVEHSTIEKLQLLFLQQKFEEKNKNHYFQMVHDLVTLNGAFSRLASDGQEGTVQTSFNPDDLLSPYACDIPTFVENVPMENCTVKVFETPDGPGYKCL